MIKIKKEDKKEPKFITMGQMEPLQVGIIEDDGIYRGTVVMRTASKCAFEVINLSNPDTNKCWESINNPILVRLLPKGEKITLEVFNNDSST